MTETASFDKHELPITKNIRYFTLGDSKSKHLLYVLHGYGQLASFFIQKFELLTQKGYFIVSPEGMHRFYLEGTSGRVGASWMTKEDRETDIKDNIQYLNVLHEFITTQGNYEQVSLLGFSQGGATAARWSAQFQGNFTQLVLWACVFPEDMKMHFEQRQPATQLVFALGDEDPYFQDAEQQKEIKKFYAQLNFSVILYHGKHQIDQDTLTSIFTIK